jgi:sec-independent protein translocase protein TatB
MFGLGMGEIVIIAIVALLFLGPDKLPTAAKSIGKTIRGFRAQTRELTDSLERDTELGDAVRELRSALHDDPLRAQQHRPSEAGAEAGADSEAGADFEVGSESGDQHLGQHDPQHAAPETLAEADEELDESLELAEPIGGEPDVPTVRPAAGSVARLYSDSTDDAPTEPPSRPKPAGEGNA